MSEPIITRVAVYWTACPEPFSRGIRYFTRPGLMPLPLARVSHVGLRFEGLFGNPGEQSLESIVHEALYDSGWVARPWSKLVDFAARDPRNLVVFDWLDIPSDQAQRIYLSSLDWIGEKRSYGRGQIMGFLVAQSLLGRTLGLSLKNDQAKVICSEGVACHVCLGTDGRFDYRQTQHESFDAVSPESALQRHLQLTGKAAGELQRLMGSGASASWSFTMRRAA